MEPNVIGVREASEKKGCTRQTIYNAIDRGELNTVKTGGVLLILKDSKWKKYRPNETGGRMHKQHREQPNQD